MRGKPLIKIGDIFKIPLSNKKKAFGQYVFLDEKTGPIVQIFDLILDSNQAINMKLIVSSKLLFPPVYTGIGGIIKLGRWKIVGHENETNYHFYGFLDIRYDIKTKVIKKWLFYNGKTTKDLGSSLPTKYRNLEERVILPYDHIEKRIETGFSSFDFIKRHGRWPKKEEIPWEVNK